MITAKERKYLLDNMMELLDEYDYIYTVSALNSIIDEWDEQKAPLIEAFKRHPNYVDGKFLIAFNYDYERTIDNGAMYAFKRWLMSSCVRDLTYHDNLPDDLWTDINKDAVWLPDKLFRFFDKLDILIDGRVISKDIASFLKEHLPQAHVHAGEKSSRAVNKICKYLKYDRHPDYNREFAKFADALSPIKISRHTVLSLNPLDYLTMSFGNSWASCHTIDKHNKRNMPNSYEGAYSSGTVSYMLDGSSMVFYTVDKKYKGNDYWTQPKINRQMFHWGQEKLVQGRLYPQDNDDDDNGLYAQYRNIVQEVMSNIFAFPNLWVLSKGTHASERYIYSHGTHYRDYEHYENCSLSVIKGNDNSECFDVGAKPICIECGERHGVSENINCCSSKIKCSRCGRLVNVDDALESDDEYYCPDCTRYCDHCGCYEPIDNVQYIDNLEMWICEDCMSCYYSLCENCGEYYRDRDAVWSNRHEAYVCPNCAAEEEEEDE